MKNILKTTDSRINEIVIKWMEEYDVPGCSITITKDDRILFTKGYGVKNIKNDSPSTKNTVYGMGSCSKTFTAIAILKLYDEGKIDIHDNISKYNSLIKNDDITIHDLLCHSSGMPSDAFADERFNQLLGRYDEKSGVPLTSNSDFEFFIKNTTHQQSKDNKFRYYNTGYIILGRIIENVSNKTYEQYIKENIFDKININDYHFLGVDTEHEKTAMTYLNGRDNNQGDPYKNGGKELNPAGGLFTSTIELSKFLRALLNEEIISEKSYNKMMNKHNIRVEYIDNENLHYGYGIQMQNFLNDKLISHTGYILASSAWMAGFPTDKLGITIACNTGTSRGPSAVGKAILSELKGFNHKENVYPYYRDEKISPILGTYQSNNGIVKATVEKYTNGLKLNIDYGKDEVEYVIFPEDLEKLNFYIITPWSAKTPISFYNQDDKNYLEFRRWKLSQIN